MTWQWSWTNWTFGFWWGKLGHKRAWGIDLGPLEMYREY